MATDEWEGQRTSKSKCTAIEKKKKYVKGILSLMILENGDVSVCLGQGLWQRRQCCGLEGW